MPTTPTLQSPMASSSHPHLPPPRHLTRTTRLPPPQFRLPEPDSSLNHAVHQGQYSAEEAMMVQSVRSHMHDRRQRPPPPLASDDLPLSTSEEEEEDQAQTMTSARSGHERHESRSRYLHDEVDGSMLSMEEEAQISAHEEGELEHTAELVDDTEEAGEVTADEAMEGLEVEPQFDAIGLKEIGNLASWTVSTHKPGSGVEALRADDTSLFWQSDGPQPHHLNIHFSRLVSILSIRIFLDFEADESYTPTRLVLLAGTGYHDLIPFASLEFTQPKGWIDVPLENIGGGKDGNELRAFLVQLKVVENHQNGKDTHVRGLKIYARDERIRHGDGLELAELMDVTGKVKEKQRQERVPAYFLAEPDWMGEPELR